MMIARSDIIILVVASTALATGIYRWQHNVQTVSSVTIPANTRVRVSTAPVTPVVSLEPKASGTTNQPLANNPLSSDDTAATASESTLVAEAAAVVDYGIYSVVSGDYLERIAKRYSTSVSTLQKLNDLTGTTIQIGQKLRYPLSAN
jgi:LysM repeat protein